MPELNMDEINKAVKDSAYAAIGFSVLGFQRAQVRRRELAEQLTTNGTVGSQLEAAREQLSQLAKLVEDQVGPAREQLVSYAKVVDSQVAPALKQLDNSLDELESRLPASARNAFSTLRQGARTPERFVRSAVGLEGSATR